MEDGINILNFDLRDRVCRSRCDLQLNVAGHIEQKICRSESLVIGGLPYPPDVLCSKSPEVIGY